MGQQPAAEQKTAPPPSGAPQPTASPKPNVPQHKINTDNPTLSEVSNIGSAVALANEKTKEMKKKNSQNIPTEMAPRWELIVDEATQRIKNKRDLIIQAIGDKPYQGIPIDEDEAQIRYTQMRNDVELQSQALEPNVIKAKDGRLLINKKYIDKLIELETKIRKGEILV
jgi:hypothetical protein